MTQPQEDSLLKLLNWCEDVKDIHDPEADDLMNNVKEEFNL